MKNKLGFDLRFFKGKRILVTGHLGFKGSYLCKILASAGAEVCGCGIKQEGLSLFEIWHLGDLMQDRRVDICNFEQLKQCFSDFKPEMVFHLAAQALVIPSYENPMQTFRSNIMGSVNLLECIRLCGCVRAVVNVTSDKVYKNDESGRLYTEDDPLMGRDPYSASKSCAEILSFSYRKSFFEAMGISISTARAGNVLGGGDFSKNRVIPDCVRAAKSSNGIILRNPDSVRPYQHVFDCLYGYLLLMKRQCEDSALAGSYNFAPIDGRAVTTYRLASLFCEYWGDGAFIESPPPRQDALPQKNISNKENNFHEAGYLKLDVTKANNLLGFSPKYTVEECIRKTVEFEKLMLSGGDSKEYINREIDEYFDK